MATTRTPTTPARTRKTTRKPVVQKETGTFGRLMMVLFWLVVLFLGPGFLLTGVYLSLTMCVLTLIAKIKGTWFSEEFGNNNWVFFATLAMAVASGVMSYMNPLVPQDPVSWLMSWFTSVPEVSGEGTFWGILNWLFFGEALTEGWGDAMLTYGLWIIPAFVVSFSEETMEFGKKLLTHLAKGEGLASFALKDGLLELFWKIFKKG